MKRLSARLSVKSIRRTSCECWLCKGGRRFDAEYVVVSIGEETYAAEGMMELTDEFTWIVDPIDGK